MKFLKKPLYILLAFLMVLSSPIPAFTVLAYDTDEFLDDSVVTSTDDVSGYEFESSEESGYMEESEAGDSMPAPTSFEIMTLAEAAAEPIFTARTTVDNDEHTVAVHLSVENNPGIDYFRFLYRYDTDILTYSSEYDIAEHLDFIRIYDHESPYFDSCTFSFMNLDEIPFDEDGEFFVVIFDINEAVQDEEYSFTVEGNYDYDLYGSYGTVPPIPVSFIVGDIEQVIPVETITIDPHPSTFKMMGDQFKFTATIEPEEPTNPNVVWSLQTIAQDDDPGGILGYSPYVAVITQDGLFTPYNRPGKVRVTATAADGRGAKDSIEIDVVKSVTSVSYSLANTIDYALGLGGEFQLKPGVLPADAFNTDISYKSDNESVVAVDGNGLVTAVGYGITYVWATSDDDVAISCPMLFCVLDETAGPAASVGGQSYDTLDEAVAAAVSGDTITLLKDQSYPGVLTMPDGCSLDLGGKTLYIKQIRIADEVTVPYIGNGTLIGMHTTNDVQRWERAVIALLSDARLEYLGDMKIFYSGGGSIYPPIVLWRSNSGLPMLDEINNCEITAYWAYVDTDAKISYEPKIILNYLGAVMRVSDVTATAKGSNTRFYGAETHSCEIHIYSGKYDTDRAAIFESFSGVINIYGGSFRASPTTSMFAPGYEAKYADGWWTVVRGATPAVLNISVEPANAALTLKDTDTGETVTPTPLGGLYAFDLWMDHEYEYNVSADGYVTKTGYIPISFAEADVTIALVKVSGADEGAKDVSVKGGDFITAGGSYRIEKGDPNVSYGVITVATREPVKLIGLGISGDDALFRDLTIDCASGADLTVENLWINNNRGQGTGSGPTNMGVNIINFKGGGNVLKVSGENLLENQEYVQGAGIHVPPGAELTFAGDGVLYFYKYSQGCGIGGNAYEPCGDITFRSGRYFIKGSKTGAVIGGDGMGSSAKNGDITISGGEIVIVSVATGDAIGESSKATCGGDVYIRGGNLTTISCWSGLGIGSGNLYITGGSYKPVMTGNAISGMPNSNTHYVREDAVYAFKYAGAAYGGGGGGIYSNGKPARLFTFDTGLLSRSAGSFSVSGATNYSGGLHDYVYTGAASTVASFRRAATDKNLYFYLPTEKDQKLTVNGETFTVSWDAEKAEFAVTKGSGSGQTDAPTVVKVDPLEVETAVDDGKAVGTVDAAEVKELLEEAVKKLEEAVAGGEKNVVAEIDLDMRTGGSKDVTAAELTVKADGLTLLAERNDIVVTVQSDIWDITLDNATLKGLAADSKGKDLIITQETVNAAALDGPRREAAGNNPVVSLTVSLGDSRVSEFKGTVTVKAPYSPPADIAAADYDLLTVYRLDAGGGIVEMDTASYDAKTGIMSFETGSPSAFFVSEWLSPFDDARRGDWYYKAMRFVYSEGLMTGVTDDEFAPKTNLSRAMLVTVLYRYEGEPEIAGGNAGFTDAADGMWYSDAVAWAVGNGIVKGYGDGLFGTNESITREELATILYRYSEQTGGDGGLDGYEDGELTSDWAADALRWAVDEGVMQGKSETTIDPLGTATRAETATMLMRFDSLTMGEQ
jgi:uncharacterized protein YjdB